MSALAAGLSPVSESQMGFSLHSVASSCSVSWLSSCDTILMKSSYLHHKIKDKKMRKLIF